MGKKVERVRRAQRVRVSRLRDAQQQQAEIQELAAFARIRATVTDEGRHWRFYHGRVFLLSFWPASGKARLAEGPLEACASLQRALRMAKTVMAKRLRQRPA